MSTSNLVRGSSRWVVRAPGVREGPPGFWCDNPQNIPRVVARKVGFDERAQRGFFIVITVPTYPARQHCIALSREESEENCGRFPLEELLTVLQYFFGHFHEYLDFGRPLSGPYLKVWLQFFISENSKFGTAYAWVNSWIANVEAYRWEKELAFPAIMYDPPGYSIDNVLSGISHANALYDIKDRVGRRDMLDLLERPSALKVTHSAEAGTVLINTPDAHPRREWDLCANQIVPGAWLLAREGPTYDVAREYRRWTLPEMLRRESIIWTVSHAWVEDRQQVWTPINNYEWPVPLPAGVSLDAIREELLKYGCTYVWLDVLCLRQESSHDPSLTELRAKECQVDVPLIGTIYKFAPCTFVYFSGLGRPFQPTGWEKPTNWLRRAWTLQETPDIRDMIVCGINPADQDRVLTTVIDQRDGTTLGKCIRRLYKSLSSSDTAALLRELMKPRNATYPADRVGALMLTVASPAHLAIAPCVPLYHATDDGGLAWQRYWFAHSKSQFDNELSDFYANFLCLFPNPSANHYFPSWAQVNKFPDVSITEPEGPDPLIELQDSDNFDSILPRGCGLNFGSGWIFEGVQFQRWTSNSLLVVPERSKINCSHGVLQAVSTTEDGLLHMGRLVEGESYTLLAPTGIRIRSMNGHLKTDVTDLRPDGGDPMTPPWKGLIFYVCRKLGTNNSTASLNASECVHLRRVTTLRGAMLGRHEIDSRVFTADAMLARSPKRGFASPRRFARLY